MTLSLNFYEKSNLSLWKNYCDKKMECEKLTEENAKLTELAAMHASRADELYDALECICSYLSEDGLTTMGLTKEIVNAQAILRKTHSKAPD